MINNLVGQQEYRLKKTSEWLLQRHAGSQCNHVAVMEDDQHLLLSSLVMVCSVCVCVKQQRLKSCSQSSLLCDLYRGYS